MTNPIKLPVNLSPKPSFLMDIAIPGTPSTLEGVELDTGSTGLVIPASFLYVDGQYTAGANGEVMSGTLLPGVTIGAPAQIKYEPSNKIFNGYHYTVAKLLLGTGQTGAGESPATALNVTLIGVTDHAEFPRMCGIGFGRAVTGDNPFLCIEGMATGEMYPSYLLTVRGIWLGCTPEQAAAQLAGSKFGFQKLNYTGAGQSPPPNSSQWSTPLGFFRVSTLNPGDLMPFEVLLDTGVVLAMVKSSALDWLSPAAEGAEVSIEVPLYPADLSLSYRFNISKRQKVDHVGEAFATGNVAGSTPPPWLALRGSDANFVNTGFHLLNSYQLYFDAKIGQAGYAAYPT